MLSQNQDMGPDLEPISAQELNLLSTQYQDLSADDLGQIPSLYPDIPPALLQALASGPHGDYGVYTSWFKMSSVGAGVGGYENGGREHGGLALGHVPTKSEWSPYVPWDGWQHADWAVPRTQWYSWWPESAGFLAFPQAYCDPPVPWSPNNVNAVEKLIDQVAQGFDEEQMKQLHFEYSHLARFGKLLAEMYLRNYPDLHCFLFGQ